MGKYIKTICALLVILSQLMVSFAYGQTIETAPKAKVVSYPTGQGTQAEAFNNGTTNTNSSSSGDASALAADAVGCSVGQILGNLAMTGVSSVMGSIKGTVTSTVGGTTGTNQRVPITNSEIESNTAKLANKETGGGSSSFADALAGALDSASWDAVGFCLANASIQYLTQSTVNWINSGFEGNPTFIDNPEKFFQDLADIELAGLVNELGLGFMCSGVAPKVRIALVNDYLNRTGGKTFNDRYKCSFDKLGTNVDAFMNNFQNGGINAYVEFVYNPANRPSTAYLAAQDELSKRINAKQGQAQFELRATDFLPFKNCKTVRDPKTGKETKDDCNTYTPGQMIEDQVNNAINSPRNRLEIADEFDEVVAALINQLIRTALSEITSVGTDNNNDDDNEEELKIEEQQQISVQSGGTGYTPPQLPAVSVVCNVATTTVMVDEPVLVTAVARGGNRQYVYDWLGSNNFPTSTRASSLNISFGSTTDASIISVRVRSAGKVATARCPAIKVTAPVPLEVSCEPDDTAVSVGESVTWLSNVSGGTGYYTYEWGGDVSSFSKTSQDNTVSFNTKGTYGATLKVTSGSQVQSVSCKKNVKVR